MAKRYEDINGRSETHAQARAKTKPRMNEGQQAANVSWGLANPEMLAWCIASVVKDGGALIFGTTRDGGALSITVLYGDDKEKYYITPSDDLNLKLKEIGEYYGT